MKRENLIVKTWERCKSIGRSSSSSSSFDRDLKKKKKKNKRQVVPDGCFSVYVGKQRQRFVIKTEYANHPLFKMLLDEAESEYGYTSEGPLSLPCNVDYFWKVLLAMDDDDGGGGGEGSEMRRGCGFPMSPAASYRRFSPSRLIAINQF